MRSVAAACPPGQQHSLLFAPLLQTLTSRERLTVLDVGPALPETVDFFARYRCRLVFADLLDDRVEPHAEEAPPQWQARFAQGLNVASDTRFDLCLFWELFNFLDDHALRALSRVLQPFLQRGCRGHGLGLQQGTQHLPRRLYSIASGDKFCLRQPLAQPQWPCFVRPPALLPRALPDFALDRAVLLANGRLEYTLRVD